VGDQPLHLTRKEYGILEFLSLRKGTTQTKEMFLNHLYGGMDEPELKIIDVFVCKLRKKLTQATGGEHYIETVWGRGYELRDPVGAVPTSLRGAGRLMACSPSGVLGRGAGPQRASAGFLGISDRRDCSNPAAAEEQV
jgi:hypothetical protein